MLETTRIHPLTHQSTSSDGLVLHNRSSFYDAVAAAACLVGVVVGIDEVAADDPAEGPGVDDRSRLRVDPLKLMLKLPIFLCKCPDVEPCR